MLEAYHSDRVPERPTNCYQSMNYMMKPLHQLLISLAEFIECLDLALKYLQDGINGVPSFKLCGVGMGGYIFSRHILILPRGLVKYCAHVRSTVTGCRVGLGWRHGTLECLIVRGVTVG